MGRIILYLLIFAVVFGENKDLNIYPSSMKQLNFTTKAEKEFNENYKNFENLLKIMSEKNIEYEELNEDDKRLYDSAEETFSNYWQTITNGCNWYCGGGPVGLSVSSYLGEDEGITSYLPHYITDFSYQTAWVEGVKGDGIGEWIKFNFKNSAPVTSVIISNGYVKNRALYKANGRVKRLKLYINDELCKILNFNDVCSEQRFDLDIIEFERDKTYVLKFEIAEVYKGTKYDDTVISEINFDGIGVH